MATTRNSNARSCDWTFLVYPGDNCPSDYVDLLDDLHVEWCESPLHDSDVSGYDDDGNAILKKAHKHIVLHYDTPKRYNQVCDDIICCYEDGVICAPQAVRSLGKLVRYFAHLDNPEKFQYDRDSIVGHCGFNVSDYIVSKSDMAASNRKVVTDILTFCRESYVFEFCDLVDICIANNKNEWLDFLINKPYIFNNYLRSFQLSMGKRWARETNNAYPRLPDGWKSVWSKDSNPFVNSVDSGCNAGDSIEIDTGIQLSFDD